ncbi:hypothetical protein MILUP08_41778 [Micromonospora lupini str. Lupac 08]|uniref:Uncharacterized protein n=1 Tax=Micromonospora lupini str. Lupac 08 TaxID=1150864 RepID=I0KZ64_9ACTN|nr:hypothetical protein MILUP08_41778 [Micromonospora lupini str. Lupac 08]
MVVSNSVDAFTTCRPGKDVSEKFRNYAAAAGTLEPRFRPVGIMRRYQRGEDGRWHDALLIDLLADDLTE